jgi:hypothetical protein
MVEDAIAQSTVNIQASVLVQKMRHCVMRKAGLPLNQVTPVLLMFLLHILMEFMSEGVALSCMVLSMSWCSAAFTCFSAQVATASCRSFPASIW